LATFEKIWQEQCEAAETIMARYGQSAAFDYLVGEKLLHYVSAAKDRPEFARQLPVFVAGVRRLFPASEIGPQVEALQAKLVERASQDDEIDFDLPSPAHEELDSLRQVADLLLAPNLGVA
jgi:hypothetical protein